LVFTCQPSSPSSLLSHLSVFPVTSFLEFVQRFLLPFFFFFHSFFARVLLRIAPSSPFSLPANPWCWHGPPFGIRIGHLYIIPGQDSGVLSIISELLLTCHSSVCSGSFLQTSFAWSGSSAAVFPRPRYLKRRSRRLFLCPLPGTALAHRGVHCDAVY